MGDLGSDELDGGDVLEERHVHLAAFLWADGVAVAAVGDAEALAAEGALVALASVDGEGAAAAEFGFRFRLVGHADSSGFVGSV